MFGVNRTLPSAVISPVPSRFGVTEVTEILVPVSFAMASTVTGSPWMVWASSSTRSGQRRVSWTCVLMKVSLCVWPSVAIESGVNFAGPE